MGRDFFLGKWKDDPAGEPARVAPDRFTTHGVIIGMTGSGKTGLVVSLLEEAALAGIPALVIDPKGDLTDRLLVFPGGRPEDFAPYCPAGRAEDTARGWSDGLASWGLGPQDATALKGVPVRVFTPGASAAPINVLQRFDPPGQPDAEALGSSALGAVSSLFMLAGFDGDPGTCPEGLLLNQLLFKAWSEGLGVTLEDLVQQVLTPPLQRLGIMDLDAVIPPKERTALAMKLNALLASPTLALWRQGDPLDLEAFLGPKAGASQTIFTLAHLSENERLFFLGLLLSELSAWTRRQPGTEHLRALIVFDEVYGFFPPHPLNPPTKGPLLSLLKQARAFGVGLVLASQNPVDLDYKGLTNAGLWFLGRLQTEQDRRRVSDALGDLPGGGAAAELLADLPPRTFVVHDVRASGPRLLSTRQCVSYLAGPLTAPQLKGLLSRAPEAPPPPSGATPVTLKGAAPAGPQASPGRPIVPATWESLFSAGDSLAVYLEVEAEITYRLSPKSAPLLRRARLAWPLSGVTIEEALAADPVSASDAPRLDAPQPSASCAPLPPYFDKTDPAKAARLAAASIARRQNLDLLKDPLTETLQDPGESAETFRSRAATLRIAASRDELEKKLGPLQRQLQKAQDKVAKLELELESDRSDASARTAETVVSAGLGLLGGLFGSRRSIGGAISRTVSKTRMAGRAKDEVQEDQAQLDSARRERDQLQGQLDGARGDITSRYESQPFETVTILPAKSGVQVLACRLLWAPSPTGA